MSAESARRPSKIRRLSSPATPEIVDMFVERNPQVDREQVEAVGTLVAEFGAEVARLSEASRQRLAGADLPELISGTMEAILRLSADPTIRKAVPKAAPEVSQGEGLGEVVSAAEGQKRLDDYATPLKVEEWAGSVAGATELSRDHGIARSTLHAWQKQGAVLGLQVGVRKHAFPVEQFIDGRPVAGLPRVLETIGDPRTAWFWLREPNPGLAGAAPLACLKSGSIDQVIEVARSNFDRE